MKRKKYYGRWITGIVVTVCMTFIMVVAANVFKATNSADAKLSDRIVEGKIEEIFPESYRAALKALQAAHPNWVFKAFNTGLAWTDCFGQTGNYSESELDLARNLIAISDKTSAWKSTTIDGAYNWAANSWNVLSGNVFVQASEEAIKYCMDPRNFLTEQQIFQFEDTGYQSYQTLSGVQQILKGTFMENGKIKNNSGNEITYAEALLSIGKSLGASPYLLATRVRQEQGVNGTSPLISGTQSFTYKGKTYSGYYNYFNINAGGGNQAEVIQNGLVEAYEGGWDTPYKALYGGAQKLFNTYISRGQTTLYLQKFNVIIEDENGNPNNRLFWGQYMQAILAPQSEATNVYKTYTSLGAVDSSLVFVIPVYSNMPGSVSPQPTKDGNPNYKLGAISYKYSGIDVTSMPGFSCDTDAYTITVPDQVTSVTLYATPYASTVFGQESTTAINGVYTSLTKSVTLSGKSTVYKLNVVAQNGDSKVYTVTIKRNNPTSTTTPPTSAEETTTTTTQKVTINTNYTISGDYISGITAGTAVKNFKTNLNVTGNASAVVYDKAGAKAGDTALVGTGMTVKVGSDYAYQIVVKGDASGDGKISLLDMVKAERHVLGYEALNGSAKLAADVNGDGKISLVDIVKMERHILGYEPLS